MKHAGLLICAFFFFVTGYSQVIEVSAGNHSRSEVPVQVHLPQPLSLKSRYQLVNEQTGVRTPAQLLDSHTLVFILPEKLAAGATARYTLKRVKRKGKNAVHIKKEQAGLRFMVNKRPVFFYHTAEAQPPADSPAYYKRSGFIHPLYSPAGSILTDDFPAGHTHHHGVFHAWVNTTFKKRFTDFWNQHLKTATVEHVAVTGMKEGPVLAQLQVLLRYKSFAYGEVLQEKWTIQCYPFSDHFLFDLYLQQQNTSGDTLYLNKHVYGGMAMRGSRQWNPADKKHYTNSWNILTSEGIRDSAANHTHARWVDASGSIDGGVAGVTVFNHPSNFRYPQAIRVHPTMPYWVYAPMVDGPFTIDPGSTYRAQFRYFVHEGPVEPAVLETISTNWAEPPTVRVIAE